MTPYYGHSTKANIGLQITEQHATTWSLLPASILPACRNGVVTRTASSNRVTILADPAPDVKFSFRKTRPLFRNAPLAFDPAHPVSAPEGNPGLRHRGTRRWTGATRSLRVTMAAVIIMPMVSGFPARRRRWPVETLGGSGGAPLPLPSLSQSETPCVCGPKFLPREPRGWTPVKP